MSFVLIVLYFIFVPISQFQQNQPIEINEGIVTLKHDISSKYVSRCKGFIIPILFRTKRKVRAKIITERKNLNWLVGSYIVMRSK